MKELCPSRRILLVNIYIYIKIMIKLFVFIHFSNNKYIKIYIKKYFSFTLKNTNEKIKNWNVTGLVRIG